jgi:Flp pilus assembly secretin CpaC
MEAATTSDRRAVVPAKAASARRPDRRQQVALATGALLVAAALIFSGNAKAADLVVVYDQSQLLRLPRPVSSIIIGNPSIADVEIQGGNLLVVTGKTFGVTNIIALDADRNIIQDQRVVVSRDDVRTVNLSKGSERESYSCTPSCSPTLTIGDDKDYFSRISQHATAKTRFSNGAGGGNSE